MTHTRAHHARRGESGYSLVEMLVVIAIIGIVSLITVPQFIAMQRSGQLKASMRQVMNDLRLVQQKAITQRTDARFRFANNGTGYFLEVLDDGNWVGTGVSVSASGMRTLEPGCTISIPNNLGTTTIDGEAFNTVVYRQNGTAEVTGTGGTFVVRTIHPISKPAYTVTVPMVGSPKAL